MNAKDVLDKINSYNIAAVFYDNSNCTLKQDYYQIKTEDVQKVAERIIALALMVLDSNELQEAKKTMRSALPYLRYAVEQAREDNGEAHLAIVSRLPNDDGKKLISSFRCEEFFRDLEVLSDALPQSAEDNLRAQAAEFMDTHHLTIIKLDDAPDHTGD